THPEALGVLVRMLRASARPIEAYRYLAQNAREVTRVGTWEVDDATERATLGRRFERVRMTYRPRLDGAEDSTERVDAAGEELLCDARAAELASLPQIWGFAEAEIEHP